MQLESLAAWLGWLEQNHPQEIDLGLARVSCVAERMGLLQPGATVVTVGGTNGKGSCVASIAALLARANQSVGVYTSPHLINYNERIVIDGVPATDEEICSAFAAIYAACHETSSDAPLPVSLTYFEYGTLAALEIFRRRNVTTMVLEVGLGGRLDAVNVIDADIAVITSIALDHTDWLGDDRDSIGYEKAGIMRAGKPVICADFSPPATILGQADAVGASLYLINRDFGYARECGGTWSWWSGAKEYRDQPLPQLPLPSVSAALQVAQLLGLDLASISAFKRVAALSVPGRFQVIQWHDRQVILDVAHNPAATAYLVDRLVENAEPASRVHAIVAMMSDKDRVQSLANLRGRVQRWYLTDLPQVSRAATLAQMQQTLLDLGLTEEYAGSMSDCLQAALKHSVPGDRILIFGSFYTVAAGLRALDRPAL